MRRKLVPLYFAVVLILLFSAKRSIAITPSNAQANDCIYHRVVNTVRESFSDLLSRFNKAKLEQEDSVETRKKKSVERNQISTQIDERTIKQFQLLVDSFFSATRNLKEPDTVASLKKLRTEGHDQERIPYELNDRAIVDNGIRTSDADQYINQDYLKSWIEESSWSTGVESPAQSRQREPTRDLTHVGNSINKLEQSDKDFFLKKLLPIQIFNSLHSQNIIDFAPMTGRFEEYLWTNGSKLSPSEPDLVRDTFMSTITPIGAYGERFSREMQRTTQLLMSLVSGHLSADAKKVYDLDPELIKSITARGRDYKSEKGPLMTLNEGILTLHQAVSLLLSEKVPGTDSGIEALRILLNDPRQDLGPIAELAAHSPMGLIGPSVMRGVYFPKSLSVTDKGLRLSPDFRKYLLNERKRRGESIAKQVRKHAAGLGCPFARRLAMATSSENNVIKDMGILYFKIFQWVHENPSH